MSHSKDKFFSHIIHLEHKIEELNRLDRTVNVLEWGMGSSTQLFVEKLHAANIYSIEHNSQYALPLVPQNPKIKHSVLLRTTYQLYGGSMDYVTAPLLLMLEKLPLFDFIFIDGRLRADCGAVASLVCRDDGEVMIHDYQRSNYHQATHYFKESFIFDDGGSLTASFKKPFLKILQA